MRPASVSCLYRCPNKTRKKINTLEKKIKALNRFLNSLLLKRRLALLTNNVSCEITCNRKNDWIHCLQKHWVGYLNAINDCLQPLTDHFCQYDGLEYYSQFLLSVILLGWRFKSVTLWNINWNLFLMPRKNFRCFNSYFEH